MVPSDKDIAELLEISLTYVRALTISPVLELSFICAENSAHTSNDLFAGYCLQNVRVV